MSYVDGYILPVPKKKLAAYKRLASKFSRIVREHGALEYRECAGDDLQSKCGVPYRKLLKLKPGETAVFAWVIFKSRAHRDKVNAAVMKDPRLAKMNPADMPFDLKRMSCGGFTTLVQA